MKRFNRLKKNKVNKMGKLKENIELPKEKHLKYIPYIREHFKLDNTYTIIKDYQIFADNNKGNWLIMKNNRICMVLYNDYVKELFKGSE